MTRLAFGRLTPPDHENPVLTFILYGARQTQSRSATPASLYVFPSRACRLGEQSESPRVARQKQRIATSGSIDAPSCAREMSTRTAGFVRNAEPKNPRDTALYPFDA